MVTKKPTDLTSTGIKSVSLEQVKKLDGKTVVAGGASVESAGTAEKKGEADARKIDKAIEKMDKNPTQEGGSSTGADNKAYEKDQLKRGEDGLPPHIPPKN